MTCHPAVPIYGVTIPPQHARCLPQCRIQHVYSCCTPFLFFVFCFLEISDALADFFSLFSVDVVSTAHHDEMRARISGHAQWQLKRPCLPTTTTHPRVLLRSRILPTPPPLLLCNRRPSLAPFERRYVSVKINGNTTFLPDKRSRSRREKNE